MAATLALRQATADIHRGEFVAIAGASGSGKTTLLSILGLLDRPSSGSYWLDDVNVGLLSESQLNRLRARTFGFVFQNSYLLAEESVGENVALGLKVRGVPSLQRQVIVKRSLAQVGLMGTADKRAGECSGGEKQRVAVARALATAPEVILADEPTGALDLASTNQLIALLRRINADGMTIIVVTHDPLVAAAATRSITITDGVTSD
ncbi:MAG: ABC transporter ATP-binding protein [Propionibacteriaceae bacterium]|nr:ABC transporter ATP-binding protein [Propionibacteriaceae bacterium]